MKMKKKCIKIGRKYYQVLEVDKIEPRNTRVKMKLLFSNAFIGGQINTNVFHNSSEYNHILLREDLKTEIKHKTLYHEICHGIINELLMKYPQLDVFDTEEFVDDFSKILIGVFKPKIK